jgi:predicted MPP superfamily phosphohydrolase
MYEPELAVPFYAVLGNHDYQHGNERFELAYGRDSPQSRRRSPLGRTGWSCRSATRW